MLDNDYVLKGLPNMLENINAGKTIDKVISDRIYECNFILTVMVVLLHSTFKSASTDGYDIVGLEMEAMRFITVLSAVSVSMFFCISSYLFFCTIKNFSDIRNRILKRIRTIMIPYLLWSLITFVYYFIILTFTNVFDEKTIPNDFAGILLYILNAQGDPPIWYLRTLFLFFLFTPLIWWIVKNCTLLFNFILIVFFIAFNIIFRQPYSSVQFWAPQIWGGAL